MSSWALFPTSGSRCVANLSHGQLPVSLQLLREEKGEKGHKIVTNDFLSPALQSTKQRRYITDSTNYRKCVSNFLLTLLANWQWLVQQANPCKFSNLGTQIGAQSKDFGAVSHITGLGKTDLWHEVHIRKAVFKANGTRFSGREAALLATKTR